MTTYNGRRMRRRRTTAQLWEAWRPAVLALEILAIAASLWWLGRLAGVV